MIKIDHLGRGSQANSSNSIWPWFCIEVCFNVRKTEISNLKKKTLVIALLNWSSLLHTRKRKGFVPV